MSLGMHACSDPGALKVVVVAATAAGSVRDEQGQKWYRNIPY